MPKVFRLRGRIAAAVLPGQFLAISYSDGYDILTYDAISAGGGTETTSQAWYNAFNSGGDYSVTAAACPNGSKQNLAGQFYTGPGSIFNSTDGGATWARTFYDTAIGGNYGIRAKVDYSNRNLVWVSFGLRDLTASDKDALLATAVPGNGYHDIASLSAYVDNYVSLPLKVAHSSDGGVNWTATTVKDIGTNYPSRLYQNSAWPSSAYDTNPDPCSSNPGAAFVQIYSSTTGDLLGFAICDATQFTNAASWIGYSPPAVGSMGQVAPCHNGSQAYVVATVSWLGDTVTGIPGLVSTPLALPAYWDQDAGHLDATYLETVVSLVTSGGAVTNKTFHPTVGGTEQQIWIAECDETDTDALYLGTTGNYVLKYSWAGNSYSDVTPAWSGQLQDILITPTGTIIASLANGSSLEVWVSANDGATWTKTDTGDSVSAPPYARLAWSNAGSMIGVMSYDNHIIFSTDEGTTWQVSDTFGFYSPYEFTGM